MPKAEKGTPKDIANRMKAKGLQKLKFYCQMCSKQCRDENGFKCHMTSDSHLRQMKIFRDNAGGMMDSFSKEFEVGYMETLRRRHGTQRMNANNVYQEVIQDKHHVHMNSTKWATLSDFVRYLGKKGLCIVEETERGWYVTYIERDPKLLARREALERKTEADRREERTAAERRETMRAEAARALDRAGCDVERRASEIGDRETTEGRLELKLGGAGRPNDNHKKKKKRKAGISLLEEEDDDDEDDGAGGGGSKRRNEENSGGPVADSFRRTEHPKASQADIAKAQQQPTKREPERKHDNTSDGKEAKRHKTNHHHDDDDTRQKDYWLYRDIIVRIISKDLADGRYYKRKAIVLTVIDRYTAEVEVLESESDRRSSRGSSRRKDDGGGGGGDVLRIDQDDLETVIPKERNERVRIVCGRYRGRKARVETVDKRRYRAELRLSAGKMEEDQDDAGSIVTLDYEHFSKIA